MFMYMYFIYTAKKRLAGSNRPHCKYMIEIYCQKTNKQLFRILEIRQFSQLHLPINTMTINKNNKIPTCRKVLLLSSEHVIFPVHERFTL